MLGTSMETRQMMSSPLVDSSEDIFNALADTLLTTSSPAPEDYLYRPNASNERRLASRTSQGVEKSDGTSPLVGANFPYTSLPSSDQISTVSTLTQPISQRYKVKATTEPIQATCSSQSISSTSDTIRKISLVGHSPEFGCFVGRSSVTSDCSLNSLTAISCRKQLPNPTRYVDPTVVRQNSPNWVSSRPAVKAAYKPQAYATSSATSNTCPTENTTGDECSNCDTNGSIFRGHYNDNRLVEEQPTVDCRGFVECEANELRSFRGCGSTSSSASLISSNRYLGVHCGEEESSHSSYINCNSGKHTHLESLEETESEQCVDYDTAHYKEAKREECVDYDTTHYKEEKREECVDYDTAHYKEAKSEECVDYDTTHYNNDKPSYPPNVIVVSSKNNQQESKGSRSTGPSPSSIQNLDSRKYNFNSNEVRHCSECSEKVVAETPHPQVYVGASEYDDNCSTAYTGHTRRFSNTTGSVGSSGDEMHFASPKVDGTFYKANRSNTGSREAALKGPFACGEENSVASLEDESVFAEERENESLWSAQPNLGGLSERMCGLKDVETFHEHSFRDNFVANENSEMGFPQFHEKQKCNYGSSGGIGRLVQRNDNFRSGSWHGRCTGDNTAPHQHASYEGKRISYEGKGVSFEGKGISYEGKRVSYEGKGNSSNFSHRSCDTLQQAGRIEKNRSLGARRGNPNNSSEIQEKLKIPKSYPNSQAVQTQQPPTTLETFARLYGLSAQMAKVLRCLEELSGGDFEILRDDIGAWQSLKCGREVGASIPCGSRVADISIDFL